MDSDEDVPLAALSSATKIKTKKKKSKDRDRVKEEAGRDKKASGGTPKKRKREDDSKPEAVKSSSSAKKKKKLSHTGSASTSSSSKGLKKLDKAERLQYAMQSFLWWNSKEPPEGFQWVTMEHAGVSFPEAYEPHGIKMKYEGQPIDLTPLQEEA